MYSFCGTYISVYKFYIIFAFINDQSINVIFNTNNIIYYLFAHHKSLQKKKNAKQNNKCIFSFLLQVLSALDILQPPHLDFFQEMYPFFTSGLSIDFFFSNLFKLYTRDMKKIQLASILITL